MRRIALTLLLALSSLAFAPAPLPKADRRPEPPRVREMRECERELRRLGVATWAVVNRDGKDYVHFETRGQKGAHDLVGHYPVLGGDLARTLREIARLFQREFSLPPP
jgi:hypothetical protein